MTYKGVNIPRDIGRPQLWLRGVDGHRGLRIIYPNGKVEYTLLDDYYQFRQGCTSRSDQAGAIKACINYDAVHTGSKPIFIGYA